MHRLARAAIAVFAATLVLAGCATADDEQSAPAGPNGYTDAADLGDGFHLWWDRSTESGLTDLIATDANDHIVGSCLGRAGELCFVGLGPSRTALVIADPAVARGVGHFYGVDAEFIMGTGPSEDDPAVLAVRLPSERPDLEAGWSIELFDADGQPVPLE